MSVTKYHIEHPNGLLLLGDLSKDSVAALKEQLDDGREMWKLHSVSSGREFLFDPNRNLFEGNPPKGRYKLFLHGNIQDNFDLSLCGSYVEWLSSTEPSPGREGREALGNKQRCYFRSVANAPFSCSVSVVVKKLVCALDFTSSERLSDWLSIKLSALLCTRERDIGYISGQIYYLASLVPFSMLLGLVGEYGLSEVLFTGEGWSGTVAHAAALIFLEIGRAVNPELVVKAVSFSGPLCGSPALRSYIANTGRKEHHTTVNCNGVILDRLLADYQRLSPLAMADSSTWRDIYQIFFLGLSGYLPVPPAQLADYSITDLEQREYNLTHHNSIVGFDERSLQVVGRYIVTECDEPTVIEQEDAHQVLHSFRHRGPLEWRNHYSLIGFTRDAMSEVLGSEQQTPIHISFKPVLSSVKIITTELHTTITFEGGNLEAAVGRDMQQEMELTDPAHLPFRLKRGADLVLRPGQTCKLLSIQAFLNKLIVKVSGVDLPKDGVFIVRTDFGESNECEYSGQDVIVGEEATPDRLVHPTMNPNFLSAALLRVALCGQACKSHRVDRLASPSSITVDSICEDIRTEDFSIYRLWEVLLNLEALLLPDKPSVLVNELSGFWMEHGDITHLRNGCWTTFEKMSDSVIEPFMYKENEVVRFSRKAIGYVGLAGAFLFRAIAGALLIPAAILSIPFILLNVDVSLRGSQNVATAAAAGFIGMLAVPGFVVSTLSDFMSRAAKHAMLDYPTNHYKVILGKLVRVLGGNPHEVLEEIRPLEDKVISCFKEHIADLDLLECQPADIRVAIELYYREDGNNCTALHQFLRDVPVIPLKLCLVGRIHAIRMLLQDQFFIGFIGVHNAGKSTIIKRLFDVETKPDLVLRTEKVQQYRLGDWMRRLSDHHEVFRDWRGEHDRENLQVYAVDYPGTTDEREKVAAITRFTAELASFFVVMLKAGHLAGPEKAVVQIAVDSHMPFVVVINHCDSIVDEFVKNGEARLRQSYAESLGIPGSYIHFMSAISANSVYFDNSVDAFRGVLYLFLQNMIGNPLINDALAMRLISHRVISELGEDEEIAFCMPEYVGKAAMSLMSNYRPVSAPGIMLLWQKFREYYNDALHSSGIGLDVYGPQSALLAIDQLRQLASNLRIERCAYGIFVRVYLARLPHVYDQHAESLEIRDTPENSTNVRHFIDNALAICLLTEMEKQCSHYFASSYDPYLPIASAQDAPPNVSGLPAPAVETLLSLGVKVLLSVQGLYRDCVEDYGASASVAEYALEDILSRSDDFSAKDVMQCVSQVHCFVTAVDREDSERADTTRRYDSFSNLDSELDVPPHLLQTGLDTGFGLEARLYRQALRSWKELEISIKCQPFRSVASKHGKASSFEEVDIISFHSKLNDYIAAHRLNSMPIHTPPQDVATAVMKILLSLTEEEMETSLITLQCGDVFVDTESVLAQAAQEINEDPSLACLVRDSMSGFLYFDPSKCFSTSREVLESTKLTYRALGRLVGLALTHFIALPMSFPVTVYRVLLGYPVGLTDLLLVRPTLARTLASLDESALQEYRLVFTTDEEGNFAGPCVGGGDTVDAHNRISYIQCVLKYFLCCYMGDDGDNPMYQFFIGMQHICPRDLVNGLSPVCLQRLVEVPPAVITKEWRADSITYVSHVLDVEAAAFFWDVVCAPDFDECDRLRVLSFVLGSASVLSRLGTFKNLTPRFTIVIGSHLSVDSYPISLPHLHMLMLPRYATAEEMKQKLLLAIRDSDGNHTLG